MNCKNSRYLFSGILLLLSLAMMVGCDAGSTGPVSSGLSSETGYRINLASSVDMVSADSQSVITAVIIEPDGTPIRDNEEVMFACSQGGTLSDNLVMTKGGQAMVIFTAADIAGYGIITATCRGAVADIKVVVVP
jgi:hypothetical protein